MNRTAPGAAEALGSAFPSILREGPASFSDWEAAALELVRVAFPAIPTSFSRPRSRELRARQTPPGLMV